MSTSEELYQHIDSSQPVLCANTPIYVRKSEPQGLYSSPSCQSVGERLTRDPRSGGFQPTVPSTTPPSLLWAPSPASSFVESGKKYLISVYSKCSFRPWNCPASCILPFCPPPSRFPRASRQGQRPVPPAAARVPITARGRRSSRKRRRSTGRRRCRLGGGRSSGPGSPSPRARAPGRG